jgi:hypothetical protein
MLPEITVHRPRGVLPKLTVHQRTVVDYQPSWLLLAIPATIAVLRAKRKSRAQAEPPQQYATNIAEGTTSSTPRRWRPARVVLMVSPLARRHRRQTAQTAVPQEDVVGNAEATTGPGAGGGGGGLSDSTAPATDVTTAGP